MAAFQMNNSFYRPRSLAIDTHSQKYFEEDDGSILDENILDQGALDSGLEMSPPLAGSRRHSYAMSSTIFSPKTEDWQHAEMQQQASNNPFVDHHAGSFMNSAHATPFTQQNASWLANNSGACTPMLPYDGLPADFDGNGSVSYRQMQGQTPFGNPGGQALFSPATTSNGSMPTSPQKDWMSESIEARNMPKRMRPSSPGLRSHSPLLRRDGIRKKNARFDIPAERNLLNIDQLISQSTDDHEIKELKQQKRLLRNRQAALDSRQRKKQHTERLEDEKKQYTALLNDLEEELAEAKLAIDDWSRKEQQYQQYIETMTLEKEEMIRNHTLETGDLRKKVSVLTEHVQKMESTAMSTVPSAAGFTADYPDMDSLTMDGAWDNMSFLHDFPTENEVKREMSPEPVKRNETALVSEQDKPAAAQSLLLMLLLFGAYMASKGPSPSLPRVSDDVRAASATILEDIFKDAGVQQPAAAAAATTTADLATGVVGGVAPLPSGDAWFGAASGQMQPSNMVDFGSSLGSFADALSQPTEEQKHEQLFSLSAAQYNGVASHDFRRSTPVPSTSQGRRNLAETLAAMRSSSKQSATEVYTRSLLWEHVPRDVVRNFAKLVSEHNLRNDNENAGDPVG